MMQNFNILHEFTKQHARQTSCIYSYYVERAVAVKNRSWWRGPGCCVRVKSTETCPHLTKRWRKNFPGGLWGKDELFARDNHFYLFLPAVFSLPSTFRPNWQSRTKLVIMASCTSLSLSLSHLFSSSLTDPLIIGPWNEAEILESGNKKKSFSCLQMMTCIREFFRFIRAQTGELRSLMFPLIIRLFTPLFDLKFSCTSSPTHY